VLAFVLSGTAQLYAFAIFVVASGLFLYLLSRRAGGIPPTNAERRRGAHPVPLPPDPRPPGRDTATSATTPTVQAKAPPTT
jgi:hypothetical protein